MAIETPFSTLISDVIIELSQVSGTAVQTYSEDRIARLLQQTFNLCFDKLWWPDYMEWKSYTLDGSTGLVTDTITDVTRYTDYRVFYPGTDHKPLRELPKNMNPYALSGTYPRYVSASATANKLFQVWPTLSTGTIRAHARIRPTDFAATDVVKLDKDLLVYGAAMSYATSDGGNPPEAQLLLQKFQNRLKEVRASISQPVELDWRMGTMVLDRWEEVN